MQTLTDAKHAPRMSGSAYGNKAATIVRCIYDLNRVQPTEVSPQPEAVPKIAYGPSSKTSGRLSC